LVLNKKVNIFPVFNKRISGRRHYVVYSIPQ
jgi:hypothetical protein